MNKIMIKHNVFLKFRNYVMSCTFQKFLGCLMARHREIDW